MPEGRADSSKKADLRMYLWTAISSLGCVHLQSKGKGVVNQITLLQQVQFCMQIADGLVHLERMRVIHRDIAAYVSHTSR
jgi:hypothetical protein